jgi:hypothetical protein
MKLSLDKMKLPPGAIIVLVDKKDLNDLFSIYPSGFFLKPEEYKELKDRIAQLEKQNKGDRKSPYACKLNAAIDGDTVRLVADLYFQTDQPRSLVPIGLRGTLLSDAKLRLQGTDGPWQMAAVDPAPDGYVVQVEKPGDYQLVVELRFALTTSGSAGGPGAERSFDLALPGAALTTLSLELPESVRELRWNKTTEKLAADQKRFEIALGKITQLQVAWKEPVPSKFAGPLRTATGQIAVRVDDNQVVTTAELTLTDLHGKATSWKLWLPPLAKVKVTNAEKVGAKSPDQLGAQCWVLHLAAPTKEPIKLHVTVVTPRPAAKCAIGPFAVDEALRQEGIIEVKVPDNARRGLRLVYHKIAPDILDELEPPRDPPGSELIVVAVFKYWNMPAPPKNSGAATPVPALLEMDLKTVQLKVQTQVEYSLRLLPGGPNSQIAATCKIVATPLDAPVDFLDIQLPRLPQEAYPLLLEPTVPGFPANVPWASWLEASRLPVDGEWILDKSSTPAELSVPDQAAKAQRKVRVRFSQAQKKEFTLTLVGTYTLPRGASKVRLELPRPLALPDKGAQGRMEVPSGLELLVQEGEAEVPAPDKHHVTRVWDPAPLTMPVTWHLAWRPYRPEFAVISTFDIKFHLQHAHVHQQLTWEPAERPPFGAGKTPLLRLSVPPEVKALKVSSGGKLMPVDHDPKQPWVDVPVDAPGKGVLLLEYDFPLPPKHGTFPTPLLWPNQATRVESKVRLWSQPETNVVVAEPSVAKRTWTDIGTEVVTGRPDLPARVLQTEAAKPELFLRMEAAPAQLAAIVANRVLIQVRVDDDGTETYHARFLLTKMHTTHLEVAMPVPLGQLAPQFILDGKELKWKPRDATGLVAQLEVDPSLYSKKPGVVLEVLYQLKRGQPGPEGLLHNTLNPPVLQGNVVLGKVRWHVVLPSGMLAVAARGEASTEHEWQWRYWLPSLEPGSVKEELDRWQAGQETIETSGEPSLVSGCSNLEPLRVFRVARAAWFLLCSGVLLLVGLTLYVLPPPPAGWLALAVLALASVLAASWLWPELSQSVLYGALPGGFVLAGLFVIQWTLHQRYKRQLVFMPGFTRVKAGSSLIRAGSVQRNRDPSTIDAPPPDKSNQGLSSSS